MQGNYTQSLSDLMWEQSAIDTTIEDDYQSVITVLNSDSFHAFSTRLLSFVNQLWGTDYDPDKAAKEVNNRAKRQQVNLNRGTISNWFLGKSSPNMGDDSRERMYALAFALELSPTQTSELFHKVLLDRAYNPRNLAEFVYRYSLTVKKSFTEAERLLSVAKEALKKDTEDGLLVETQRIESVIFSDMDEGDLIDTIKSFRKNFTLNNVRARAEVEKLIDKIRGKLVMEEYQIHHQTDNAGKDLLGRDPDSLDYLLYIIKDQEGASKKKKGIPSLPDLFPEEIANVFPDKSTFSSKEPSSYILRKEVIFLYFYYYWATIATSKNNNYRPAELYDEFKDNLNQRLESCGLPSLYAGNPYDWMFLYCACAADDILSPLDVFRGLLAQLNQEE